MELSKQAIEAIIRDVIAEEVGKASPTPSRHIDPSGVIAIDPSTVPMEAFPFPIESDRVKLADVVSLEESPRLGCGLMELDHTSFEWTLTYDEVDYVIDGTLDIVIDGRTVRATAGEIVVIPKNTTIHFSTPDTTRFMYVCYPANWADQ
jgi:ethanolamine utilization protein EutQ